jgi:hypothetical protein
MYTEATAVIIQVLENVVAGGCGSQGWYVTEDSQKIPEGRRANGRKT